MPTGHYDRSKARPRVYSEKAKEHLRANMAKARAASYLSIEVKKAQSRNAGRATALRTAKSVLKYLPVEAKAGDTFKVGSKRKFTVIDVVPMEKTETDENGTKRTVWEQKFEQSGRAVCYGIERIYSGLCRIVWEERPTMETILKAPMFEEIDGK